VAPPDPHPSWLRRKLLAIAGEGVHAWISHSSPASRRESQNARRRGLESGSTNIARGSQVACAGAGARSAQTTCASAQCDCSYTTSAAMMRSIEASMSEYCAGRAAVGGVGLSPLRGADGSKSRKSRVAMSAAADDGGSDAMALARLAVTAVS
jgi:hypothetical protein